MIQSPCNKICKIDSISDICKGCLRYREEIGIWAAMSEAQKYWVLDDIALVRSHVYKFDLAKTA